MQKKVETSQFSDSIAELYARSIHTGVLTPVDRSLLKTAQYSNSLSEEEYHIIQRISYALRRKWIEQIDVSWISPSY